MADTTPHSKDSITLQELLADDQDMAIVKKVYASTHPMLENDEAILYIAIQSSWVAFTRECATLTNKRLILYKPQLFGDPKLDAYSWGELSEVRLSESRMFARLNFSTLDHKKIEVPDLPKTQARNAFNIAQQQIETERTRREKKSTSANEAMRSDGDASQDECNRSRTLPKSMAPHPGV